LILLKYLDSLEERNPASVLAKVRKIDWSSAKSAFDQQFPLYQLEHLEWLRTRIKFEESVEKDAVSPHWYQTTILVLVEAQKFQEFTNVVLGLNSSFFAHFAQIHILRKQPMLAAAILSRQLEFINKLKSHFHRITDYSASIKQAQIIDLEWPKIEIEKWNQKIQEADRSLGARLTRVASQLFLEKREESIPDYRGQFLHDLGERLFTFLYTNDSTTFAAMFGPYFMMSFLNFEHLKSQIGEITIFTESRVHIAAASLHDLIDICGYSLLFAEYHQNPQFKTVVEETWNKYLEAQAVLPFIAAIVQAENYKFYLPHRGLLRTNWSIRVRDLLSRLPSKTYVVGRFSEVTRVIHHSALVRRVADRLSVEGIDIFVALYLSTRPEAKGLKWGFKRPEEFRESLNEEEQSDESET
jgi:hypothetical protein